MRTIRVHELLGAGGLARTYRAEWARGSDAAVVTTTSPFAAKVLSGSEPGLRALLHREFLTLQRLHHPHLVRALDYGTFALERSGLPTEQGVVLVLELIEGLALGHTARSFAEIVTPLAQIVEALAALHQQRFVHGDLKPENMMVRSDGQGMLVDLSAALPIGEDPAARISGTLGYLAPEAGMAPIDESLDVFALGRTLHELATRASQRAERNGADRTKSQAERVAAWFPEPVRHWQARACLDDPRARPGLESLLHALRGPVPLSVVTHYVPRLVARHALLERATNRALRALEQLTPAVHTPWSVLAFIGERGSGRSRALEELRWRLTDRVEVRLVRADELTASSELGSAQVILVDGLDDEAQRDRIDALVHAGAGRRVWITAGLCAPTGHAVRYELAPLSVTEAHMLFPPRFPFSLVRRAHTRFRGRAGPLARLASESLRVRPSAAWVDAHIDEPVRALESPPAPAPLVLPSVEEIQRESWRGRTQLALDLIAQRLRHAPEDRGVLRAEAAICLLARGHTTRAATLLARVEMRSQDPHFPTLVAARAQLALKRERAQEAVELVRGLDLTQLPPALALTLCITEAAALALADHPEAEAALVRAAALTSADSPARLRYRFESTRALWLHRSGNSHAAAEAYRAALELVDREDLDDLRPSATYNLATALEQLGQLGEAIEIYQETLRLARLDPQGAGSIAASAHFALANLLLELEIHERALTHARQASEYATAPVLVAASWALEGTALARAGEHASSAAVFARVRAWMREHASGSADELDVILAERHPRPLLSSELQSLSAWAERMNAVDLHARILLLGHEDDVRIAQLERARERLGARPPPWLSLALHERLAKRYEAAGADLHAREHAEQARRSAERLLVEIPQELSGPLRKRVLALPLSAPTGEPVRTDDERHDDSTFLLDLQRRFAAARGDDELLSLALDAAMSLAAAERGFVVLERQGDRLDVRAARNVDERQLSAREHSFSRSVVREVLRTQTPLFSVRGGDDEFLSRQKSVHARKLRAVIALPFSTVAKVRGALYLDNRFVASMPGPRAREVLLFVRDQVAAALDRVLLLAELEAQNLELGRQRAELEALLLEQRTELQRRAAASRRALRSTSKFPEILGESEALQRSLALLERVASSEVTVLFEGESGTGKELFARALHQRSARAARPLVALNCGAMPEALLEAELFGARRGAYTGAVKDTRGLFAAAEGGTLFLDEVGEMPLAMQVKLLRVLQERTVRPLGGEHSVEIDVRVVAATHRSLADEVRDGRFREDLFFRLAVVRIEVPPLRARGTDVLLLAEHILERAAARHGVPLVTLAPSALRALSAHKFPGNVRELENVLTKALVVYAGDLDTLEAEHLDLALPRVPPPRPASGPGREAIEEALASCGGNVVKAAKQLGMPRATFYRTMARLGISRRGG